MIGEAHAVDPNLPNQKGPPAEVPIGLALSGGGYRSALFGLGALFYLADSGRIAQLDTIASVSGGSYTNAKAFMYNDDLRELDGQGLADHFRDFVEAMTKPSPLLGWLAIVPLVAGLGFVISATANGWVEAGSWVALILFVLALVPFFGRLAALWIWRRLFGRGTRSVPLSNVRLPRSVVEVNAKGRPVNTERVRARGRELAPDDNAVHHVFCATELNYKKFLYFTNHMVAHRRFGRGSAGDYTLKNAVDASAALPPVFAPVTASTRGFLRAPQDTPSEVLCVDGGVHDTLATEWFRADAWPEIERRRIGDDLLWRDGVVLVVNGSSPLRPKRRLSKTLGKLKIPILWWLSAHRRSFQLAFSNWDRRNYKRLDWFVDIDSDDLEESASTFRGISVAENPFYAAYGDELPDEQRAQLAASPIDWRTLVRTSERVKTVPGKIKPEMVVNLLYHGYALSWRVLTREPGGKPGYELKSKDAFASFWFRE